MSRPTAEDVVADLRACVSWGATPERLAQRPALVATAEVLGAGLPGQVTGENVFEMLDDSLRRLDRPHYVLGHYLQGRRQTGDREVDSRLTKPVAVSKVRRALQHTLALHPDTKAASVGARRLASMEELRLPMSESQWARGGYEQALLRILAEALVNQLADRPEYVLDWAEHTHYYDKLGVPIKDEVFLGLRALRDEVSQFHTYREYTTDLRPGVLSVEAGTGCDLVSVNEDSEGRLSVILGIPVVYRLATHTLSFTVHFHTDKPATEPWLLLKPRSTMSRVVFRARFLASEGPTALWHFQVPSRLQIPNSYTRYTKVAPTGPGNFEKTFDNVPPELLTGLRWNPL